MAMKIAAMLYPILCKRRYISFSRVIINHTRNTTNPPDTEPGLPPSKAVGHGCGGDHPGVDVDAVGQPEADKIPGLPLAALGLDGLEVIVCEQELGVCKAGLAVGLQALAQATLGHVGVRGEVR